MQSLPTSDNSQQDITSYNQTVTLLVDYQSLLNYQQAYAHYVIIQPHYNEAASPLLFPINYAWLRTDGKASTLASVRQAVSSGPLEISSLADRYAISEQLNNDPLNRNLLGILLLGGLAPLALAWTGCLLASRITTRQRQGLFGVLRALGSTPRQLARVLLWEQIAIYGAALILGALLGLLTAQLALPSLLLTSTLPGNNVTNGLDLFAIQDTPPAHMVVAPALGLVLSSLLLLGIVTLSLMYLSTTRLLLAQTLRINPD